jgi:hypothetical protein
VLAERRVPVLALHFADNLIDDTVAARGKGRESRSNLSQERVARLGL